MTHNAMSIILGIIAIVSLAIVGFFVFSPNPPALVTSPTVSPAENLTGSPTTSPQATPGRIDVNSLIRVEKPLPNQTIQNPLLINGQARGNWFFEANFPISILDANGRQLATAAAQADGEWMTENFVGFHAVIQFPKPTTSTGTLILEKDNPSGLPEYDADLRIPIKFDLANWSDGPTTSGGCKVGGCSGQLCLDSAQEDVITTCEWRNEYACYQSAHCERQSDGQCGWVQTQQLTVCLRDTQGPSSLQ